jgi:hypothetical protein
MIRLSDIKINPQNPRIIKDEKFKKLVASLKSLPKMMELRPIVVDENNVVQGGNMRLKALKELGYKEVPETWVKQAKDFTEHELRQFIIKDNVGYGEWDFEMLANEWDSGELIEWGLDVPDFKTDSENETDVNPKNKYGVIVVCESEGNQESVLRDLSGMGYNCKVVGT